MYSIIHGEMIEKPDTSKILDAALDARFFDPLRRPLTRLVAAKDGRIVREGTAHDKEYIYNPNDYRFLYMDFATL